MSLNVFSTFQKINKNLQEPMTDKSATFLKDGKAYGSHSRKNNLKMRKNN